MHYLSLTVFSFEGIEQCTSLKAEGDAVLAFTVFFSLYCLCFTDMYIFGYEHLAILIAGFTYDKP